MRRPFDPRLEFALDQQNRGVAVALGAATDVGEAAIIAKVKDLDAWTKRTDVRHGVAIPLPDEGVNIVTARVPLSQLEELHASEEVLSIEAARPLRPRLVRTVGSIGALAPGADQRYSAEEVVIGIVDIGCDFAHHNFIDAQGRSVIAAIWDQDGPVEPTGAQDVPEGRVYVQAEIEAALATTSPYETLGYGPEVDKPPFSIGSHGTHVMDIACGTGLGTGVPGIAAGAQVVFVDVAVNDIAWSGEEVLDYSFGDSAILLEGLSYIFRFADSVNRPCVVNVSLGTNGGPHDGSSLVEQGIDALVTARPGRAVVLAAANAHAQGIHCRGTVAQDAVVDIPWAVPEASATHTELEIWYEDTDEFKIELLDPEGEHVTSVALGKHERFYDFDDELALSITHRVYERSDSVPLKQVGIFLAKGVQGGTWTVRLHGAQVVDGTFHAWIERQDGNQASFPPGMRDNSYTLGSLSCGRESIVVGSYHAGKPGEPISYFSSSGPTRDGREKPEISAPGHDVVAAWSRTGDKAVRKSGTSMAAPAVTGAVALLLARARSRGLELTSSQIREILVRSARRNPAQTGSWDPRYGHGMVDVKAMLAAVDALPAPGV